MIRPRANQSPEWATFRVPLRFTKFDLRDYLLHVYNVPTLRINSWVQQRAPVQRGATDTRPGSGQWYRPKSWKWMSARLVKPFVWPEVPKDRSPWDGRLFDYLAAKRKAETEKSKRLQGSNVPTSDQARRLAGESVKTKEVRMLEEQAKELLEGRVRWENGTVLDPKWEEGVVDADRAKPTER